MQFRWEELPLPEETVGAENRDAVCYLPLLEATLGGGQNRWQEGHFGGKELQEPREVTCFLCGPRMAVHAHLLASKFQVFPLI